MKTKFFNQLQSETEATSQLSHYMYYSKSGGADFGNLDTLSTFLMHSDTCFGTNFNTAYNEKPIASTV